MKGKKAAGKAECVKVAIRVRPMNSHEKEQNSTICVEVDTANNTVSVSKTDTKTFQFDQDGSYSDNRSPSAGSHRGHRRLSSQQNGARRAHHYRNDDPDQTDRDHDGDDHQGADSVGNIR